MVPIRYFHQGRASAKSGSGGGSANTPRRSRIAKQTKETRFAQRAGIYDRYMFSMSMWNTVGGH